MKGGKSQMSPFQRLPFVDPGYSASTGLRRFWSTMAPSTAPMSKWADNHYFRSAPASLRLFSSAKNTHWVSSRK